VVAAQTAETQAGLRPILDYISTGWDALTRSTTNCQAVADPKLLSSSVLYLPADFASDAVQKFSQDCRIRVEHLPFVIRRPGQAGVENIQPPGLLFLPNPYVVPGGRFNEMYGWDSYFIIRGLLRAGRDGLARGMLENFFFEIEHYGTVLNANRTYYLTRSQPPFLTSMIMAVYRAEDPAGRADRGWLVRAYRDAERDYAIWTQGPHLAGNTGLSRYYDFGQGPAPESLQGEDEYYRDVAAYFLRQPGNSSYLAHQVAPPSGYLLQLCDDHLSSGPGGNCAPVVRVYISPVYYKSDRSMRESGFDVSFRFGPYGADTVNYAPVCLNSLLYKTETDMAEISTWLGYRLAAERWRQRSARRRKLMRDLMWDAKRGLFFDYDFRAGVRSSYEYATTFDPLWAGLASPEQARSVARNLSLFNHPGGLATSRRETGAQWDYPYGWAPLQLLAVEGLRRYGFVDEADRISYEFLSSVWANFRRDGNIREKYNVVTSSSETQVKEGYKINVVGFGWTNGVFLELLHQLPGGLVPRLAAEPP
jgi:alpha,alpha-trehalase